MEEKLDDVADGKAEWRPIIKEFYEPLMDPETHQLDITKLPDNLRKLIGYRVPTEDKYSMAPLYIKGFLPQ